MHPVAALGTLAVLVVVTGKYRRGDAVARRQAAKELGIGYATLKRLLDAGDSGGLG